MGGNPTAVEAVVSMEKKAELDKLRGAQLVADYTNDPNFNTVRRLVDEAYAAALKNAQGSAALTVSGGINVFDGMPDTRQSADVSHPVSRFRPTYRALTDDEKALHDAIKAKAVEMEDLFNKVGPGRYAALAVTSLETSVMWIIKELTA